MNFASMNEFVGANFVSLVLALVGIGMSWLFSWWYFRRAATRKRVWFTRRNSPLVRRTNALKGIAITFEGKQLERPYLADFIVWNAGNSPIRFTDVAPTSPLRLVAPGANFLSGVVSQSTRAENRSSASLVDGSVVLSFDYLDPGDGMVLEVIAELQEGVEELTIELQGSIIGQTHPPIYVPGLRSRTQYRSRRTLGVTLIAMAGAMIGIGLLTLFFPEMADGGLSREQGRFVASSLTISYGTIILILYALLERRRIPPALLLSVEPELPRRKPLVVPWLRRMWQSS